MYRAGLRTFLEVGPDAKLTALVGAILGGRAHAAVAVDASRGRRGDVVDLARALAQLAALGHPVRLPLWDEGVADRAVTPRKPGLTVPVCGANPGPRPQPVPAREASPPMTPKRTDRMTPPPAPAPETNGDLDAHPAAMGPPPIPS
jgi:acyl transferase domain-containing protein